MLLHKAPLTTGALFVSVLLPLGPAQLCEPHAVILADMLLEGLCLVTGKDALDDVQAWGPQVAWRHGSPCQQ